MIPLRWSFLRCWIPEVYHLTFIKKYVYVRSIYELQIYHNIISHEYTCLQAICQFRNANETYSLLISPIKLTACAKENIRVCAQLAIIISYQNKTLTSVSPTIRIYFRKHEDIFIFSIILHIAITHLFKILPQKRLGPIYPARSIPWLLMDPREQSISCYGNALVLP